MLKVTVAEWVLSLTVAPDRAATTAGDLIEDASTRGVLWFWSSVLRTTLSHFWRDLSTSPLRMVRLGLWGWLAEGVLGFILAMYVIVGMYIYGRWGPEVCQGAVCVTGAVPQWVISMLEGCFGIIIIPFVAGWMVANRSHGKELPAIFALNLVSAAIHFLYVYLSALQMRRIGQPYPGGVESMVISLYIRPLFVTAGAILFRLRVRSLQSRVL